MGDVLDDALAPWLTQARSTTRSRAGSASRITGPWSPRHRASSAAYWAATFATLPETPGPSLGITARTIGHAR